MYDWVFRHTVSTLPSDEQIHIHGRLPCRNPGEMEEGSLDCRDHGPHGQVHGDIPPNDGNLQDLLHQVPRHILFPKGNHLCEATRYPDRGSDEIGLWNLVGPS